MPPAFRFHRRRSHRKSLPDIPADIWLYIIQYLDPYSWYKDDIKSLASTNKFLYGIALPVLFNTLNLGVPDISDDESRAYAKKVVQRIQVINSSPPILDAICRLTLSGWIIRPDDDRDIDDLVDGYVTDDPNYDAAQWREELRETSQLINDGYREIVTLLSRLPRLYHLKCRDCSLVPEIFSYIYRIPNLQSLHIDGYSMCPHDLVRFQATAPSLHVFQYSLNYWSQLSLADAVKLFISLIGQFTVFSFPLNILIYILADNSLPITLPKLQKLSMFNHDVAAQDNQVDLTCITNFLSLTPNLRELRIINNIHTETPFIIPDTVIPHLKTLIAPPCVANGIAPGRALEELRILAFRRNFRESYTVVSRDIKHVVYSGELNNPEQDLSHLAQVFPEASTVEIIVEGACRRKELSDAVLSILPEFRHLKQCMIFTEKFASVPYYSCSPSYCPVGRVDDPKYRSHPTLEELQILSSHRWIWCPKDGWHSVHSGCGADPLRTMKFFEAGMKSGLSPARRDNYTQCSSSIITSFLNPMYSPKVNFKAHEDFAMVFIDTYSTARSRWLSFRRLARNSVTHAVTVDGVRFFMAPPFQQRQSHGKSLPDLPADVWLYISQRLDPCNYYETKCDIISLASTNKFLRGVAFPVLFHTLHLYAPDISDDEARMSLKKVIQRIRGINSSPPVLNAICRLTLYAWCFRPPHERDFENDDDLAGYVTGNPNFDPARFLGSLREACQLINDGYREITTLLSSLPRLYHLECHECLLVPEFFSYIFRVPNLQYLHINGYSMYTDDTVNFQIAAPSLDVFQYSPSPWYQLCLADAVKLFISLIGQFAVFSFPLDILIHVLADSSLPIALPKLQKLSMFTHDIGGLDIHDDLDRIHNFLRLTPNFRIDNE